MALKDYEHFHRIGSPLYRYKNRYKKIEHFKKIIIEQLCTCYPAINRLLSSEQEFWENAEDTLQKKENALFNGISKIESKNLLKFGTILECSAGDKIIKEEEEQNELFILLKGYAEVSKNKGGKRICLALINPGDVIGEMAFLTNKKRNADVISITNSEVLVLTENFLEKCMNTQSKLISIFLLNLSRQLAKKLADTNDLVLKLSARVNE
jgi:signal-transduction protein with cAMP-binding, CBS, and nucleotidyltransferase domain